MDEERYAGERRGLGLFLEELRPIVARELGSTSLLHHAIVRAIARPQLRHLRHARDLFNALPREQRQLLSAGIVAQPERKPDHARLLDTYRRREPEPFVCFEADAEGSDDRQRQIEMRHELMEGPSLRVLVRPNTLPSTTVKRFSSPA